MCFIDIEKGADPGLFRHTRNGGGGGGAIIKVVHAILNVIHAIVKGLGNSFKTVKLGQKCKGSLYK